MSFGKGSIVLENLRGGDKREDGEAGREVGREEPGAVMGVIRKPDLPLGFKGNGISWQCVLISPGILHVRVPFEQKKFLAWYIMENLPSVHALLKPPPYSQHSTTRSERRRDQRFYKFVVF